LNEEREGYFWEVMRGQKAPPPTEAGDLMATATATARVVSRR